MIVARWTVDVRFGHKAEAIAILKQFQAEIGPQIGTALGERLLVGSIGAGESTLVSEIELSDIAALDDHWKKLSAVPEMAAWSQRLEPHIVSGSNRWEVYRVIE